jgi:hypothetical protein
LRFDVHVRIQPDLSPISSSQALLTF